MRRLLTLLQRAESVVAAVALCVVAAALFADIVGREFFGSGIFGAQRTAVYGMVISAFLGFVLATHVGRHIRIESIDTLIPELLRPAIVRAGHAVSAAICLYLAYWSADFVSISFEQGERGMGLDVLVWPFKLILPWAFGSAALRYVCFCIDPSLEERSEGFA
ncbi:MAG: TRAP transporter small permease [Alphaproteobacteria bacterium]|nr:TRAP transporter small permease [Alphaproteobacteria bacterium]